jgi:translation initiation factor IF-3
MRGPRRDDRVRINERIRVREVRVIDETGQQLGIMAPQDAIRIARTKGLDLVEVSATAVPPVCRITDYGRYQYNEQKRARQARKHQKTIEVKEIKFRPKVDEHDYQFKKKHIERFLAEGDKVKATVFFRGREIAHPEIGRRILERLIQEVSELAVAENIPRLEGNTMHTILGPRPQAAQQKRPTPVGQAVSGPTAPSQISAGPSPISASPINAGPIGPGPSAPPSTPPAPAAGNE